MADLVTEPNLTDPDGFYAELIAAYEAMDEAETAAFSARLILILSNHIGDREVVAQALRTARAETP
jgi:hypothetical protein